MGDVAEQTARPNGDAPLEDRMSDQLRLRLWDALVETCWQFVREVTREWNPRGVSYPIRKRRMIYSFLASIWQEQLRRPLDDLGDDWGQVYLQLREHLLECAWQDVYDFIAFVVKNLPHRDVQRRSIAAVNAVLEQEASDYRFIADTLIGAALHEQKASA